MKNSLRLLLAALLAPAALFAAGFEGTIAMKMTSDGRSQDIQYSVKGDKLRIDMPAMKGAGMIIDTAKKETTMVMEEQKMYMTMPIPEAAAATGKAEDVQLEKTSETEKILGHTATKYLITDQGTKTELWLAEGLGRFMSAASSNPMGGGGRGRGASAPSAQAWEKLLAGKDLFPLRVVGKDKSGKESFRMEATAIEKQTLADSLFTPPAGYQKFDMGMMQGMLPGRNR